MNTLTVLEASKSHSGIFEVVAENEAGREKSACLVTVNGRLHTEHTHYRVFVSDTAQGSSKLEDTQAPVLRMPLLPVREIPEGNEFQLVCTITGTPLPNIEVDFIQIYRIIGLFQWQKDDRPIPDAFFRVKFRKTIEY